MTMRTIIHTLLLSLSLTAGNLFAQAPATDLWDDPVFVQEFLGSYGFLAGYEPPITEEEKQALRGLIDLIKASPKAAIQQLEPQIKSSTSAAFDFILANLYFQENPQEVIAYQVGNQYLLSVRLSNIYYFIPTYFSKFHDQKQVQISLT